MSRVRFGTRSRVAAMVGMLLLASVHATRSAMASIGEVVPVDGMVIRTDTTFVPGMYDLPNGVSIGADGVTLDLNGAELVGTDFDGAGVTCIGHDDVIIRNGRVRGYYYGLRIESGSDVQVHDNDVSGNYVDPASKSPPAPFLNINVGPDLPDFTNLGGGIYLRDLDGASITGNTCRDGENGIDLYFVDFSEILDNDCSHNTGWGIHLHGAIGNLVDGNVADHCTRPGLGDSAGMLLVMGSHGNVIANNVFRFSGDGFFIGNENGCPSNDNLIENNDGSNAGANAFEATFSSGNQFLDNIANGSNYGFWLGYSHTANVIRGNQIRANSTNGIEIEHGQDNVIEENTIVGNGGTGIVLRTDGQVHFPPAQFPCLNLPNQAASSGYSVFSNVIHSNFARGLRFESTTDSAIVNNLVAANAGGSVTSDGSGMQWAVPPSRGENIVGGPMVAGNYWDEYAGVDLDDDGIGDTDLPFTNGGLIAPPGDPFPLVGDPDIGELDNPISLCNRSWSDLGRNTRANGATFDTANGAHFATDGITLLLLEGTNGPRLSRLNPITNRYEPRDDVPETVWDGGDLQYVGGDYLATVGTAFDPGTGGGKGPKLYRYDPVFDAWDAAASSEVDGALVANEALAWDPDGGLVYATIVEVMTGADPELRRRLAIHDPQLDAWLGVTAPSPVLFGPGSEVEAHAGSVYAWPGLFNGGAVNGADSFLHVYDIATDTWTTTASLQDAGVIPGFRTGAFDIWGVSITSDLEHDLLYVIGGEGNTRAYVYDVAADTWTVTPTPVYDGGWGDALEYVASTRTLYQLDGRNADNAPQGTAAFAPRIGDITADGVVDAVDLAFLLSAWGPCPDPCCAADIDEDGEVTSTDLAQVLANWD